MKRNMDQLQTRRIYSKPEINNIKLDNEISLVLESTPPVPPVYENISLTTDYFNNNPFKTIC
jgi:hypothetical protein